MTINRRRERDDDSSRLMFRDLTLDKCKDISKIYMCEKKEFYSFYLNYMGLNEN